jgi:hypothetical protein
LFEGSYGYSLMVISNGRMFYISQPSGKLFFAGMGRGSQGAVWQKK